MQLALPKEGQAERSQQIFDLLGKKVQGKTCGAIEGIISSTP